MVFWLCIHMHYAGIKFGAAARVLRVSRHEGPTVQSSPRHRRHRLVTSASTLLSSCAAGRRRSRGRRRRERHFSQRARVGRRVRLSRAAAPVLPRALPLDANAHERTAPLEHSADVHPNAFLVRFSFAFLSIIA